jgi:hypothetical protein
VQCPKCKYEPTMSELQASPNECVRCYGVGAKQERRLPWLLFIGVAFVCLLAVGGYGYSQYQKKAAEDALYLLIDAKVRVVNGVSMELLDQSAGLTKAEFFTKADKRVKELDDVIVQILSVNDSIRPGVAQAAADYARGARAVIKAVADQAMAEAVMNVDKESFSRYVKHESDPNFRALLARPESQLREDERKALAAVQNEGDMSRSIELLRDAKLLGDVHVLRASYLQSKAKLESSIRAFQKATSEMEDSVEATQSAANRLRQLTDYDFHLSGWHLK